MIKRVGKVLKNLGLMMASLLILVVFLEGIIFRYFLVASDLPMLAENNGGLLRYESNQTGVYRIKNEIEAKFNINYQGWNSQFSDYSVAVPNGQKRVVMVGDSYIEALQVNATSSVAEILQQELSGPTTQVFRIGMSGAPLSHYVYMLREEVVQYLPDLVIVNLVHNDFDESFGLAEGTYTESFATYRSTEDQVLELMDPKPYRRNLAWYLKRTASFRYLYVRMKIFPRMLVKMVMDWIDNDSNRVTSDHYSPSVSSSNDQQIERLIRTSLRTMIDLQEEHLFALLVVIDADRSATAIAIDAGEVVPRDGLRINEMLSRIGLDMKVPVLDLQPIVEQDYRNHRRPLHFKNDYHWNQRMHGLAATAIVEKIRECAWLSNSDIQRC
jgi:hypothetical protein